MTLPLLNAAGDLPPGIHAATMRELTTRFGGPSRRRAEVARRLLHVYRLARETRNLGRFIVFGSYITAKAAPNDVDVVLVMDDRFQLYYNDSLCSRRKRRLAWEAVARALRRWVSASHWRRSACIQWRRG